jgi:phosphoribosylpyrophosphate synthetase
MDKMKIFAGSASKELAEKIATSLGIINLYINK